MIFLKVLHALGILVANLMNDCALARNKLFTIHRMLLPQVLLDVVSQFCLFKGILAGLLAQGIILQLP